MGICRLELSVASAAKCNPPFGLSLESLKIGHRTRLVDMIALSGMQKQPQLLTRPDIARSTRSCLRSVDNWINWGWLPCIKIGKSVRIHPSDFEKFLNSRRVK